MDQRGLVEQARGGEHDAFTALVDLTIARLDSAARLILRDPELARDACLDLTRRRRRRVIEVDLEPIDAAAPSDIAGDVADRDLLDGALRRLDPGHRAVVVLHFYLGMPLPDVAAAIGIPVGTARSRLHYSLVAMRASVVGQPTMSAARVVGGNPA